MKFVDAQGAGELLDDHLPMRGQVELSDLPAQAVVDEALGQLQQVVAAHAVDGTLNVEAVFEDVLEDVPALVTHFVQQVASRTGRPVSITPSAMAGLSSYAWPGNVRELRQVVERAATLSPSGKLDRADFQVLMTDPGAPGAGGVYALRPQVDSVEREAIVRALAAARGTRREAAKLLQVSLRTLFYKLRRYGLG